MKINCAISKRIKKKKKKWIFVFSFCRYKELEQKYNKPRKLLENLKFSSLLFTTFHSEIFKLLELTDISMETGKIFFQTQKVECDH